MVTSLQGRVNGKVVFIRDLSARRRNEARGATRLRGEGVVTLAGDKKEGGTRRRCTRGKGLKTRPEKKPPLGTADCNHRHRENWR